MSSFVNDNVSESKKCEQKITENQEIREQTITKIITTEEAAKNNQSKNERATNKDTKVNKSNERKTINENKSEQLSENKLTKSTTIESASLTTTVTNYDNKSNNDVIINVATIDRDRKKENIDVTEAIDNNQNQNVDGLGDNKFPTAQITQSALAVNLSVVTSCVLNMTPGDVDQQQQQQVAFVDSKQNVTISTTNIIGLPPTKVTESNNDEDISSMIPIKSADTSNSEIKVCNVKLPAIHIKTASTLPLPPLPPGITTSLAGGHMPHISSDPTFGVQLRNKNVQDQEHISNNKNINSVRDWRPDTTAANYSSVIKSGTVSASASPNMVRKTSDSSVLLPRRVSFPKSDNELVTGYLEPANPWEHVDMVKSISEIAELYITSCQKHNTQPLQPILDHLKAVDLTKKLSRQPLLSLKSITLAPSDCEALEEVLKRVQYKAIDVSNCKLDETAASALFEIIEYYEAAHELDISSNATGMTHRGWTSCIYMISHSQELQVLNAEGNPISKLSADNLGNALSTSNLHTLKLEHCGLKGSPLTGLCFKLYQNKVLKELWLAHNDLDCNDADTIAQLLKCNHYIELIDISNNNIKDEGLRHIVKALIMQSKELERRTTFQRTTAIDDDGECMSPVESSPPADLVGNNDDASLDWKIKDIESKESLKVTSKSSDLIGEKNLCKESPNLPSIEEKVKGVAAEATSDYIEREQHKVKPPLISSVGSTIDENDGDEDTDDTVRSSTIRNPLQSTSGGQSMLDKLLSMNSESSSEDGASNLSTDTLAACNSEEGSLISDDIFDSTGTTITSTNTKVPLNTGLESISQSDGAVTMTSAIVNPSTTTTSNSSASTHYEGGEVVEILQTSPRECTFFDSNKITLNESNIILENSPTNILNSVSIQSSVVNNNNNNNASPQTINMPSSATHVVSSPAFSNSGEDGNLTRTGIFEVKAVESDCLLGGGVSRVMVGDDVDMRTGDHLNVMQHHATSRALDVNKNTKLGEDFDDTHSTDSAFESASEGDISRHLPEEFTRLSTSLESTRFDDIAKELAIETATIASESNECLIAATAQVTPSSTPTPPTPPFTNLSTPLTERECLSTELSPINSCLSTSLPSVTNTTPPPTVQIGFTVSEEHIESTLPAANEVRDKMPKVTIAQESFTQKYKSNSGICTNPSPTPTPPPPSTSPGGASSGLRRTESSSCGFLTQSSRNRSQSTDSLCSDNSLDGSIGSGDLNFSSSSSNLNEKITKNDTLTRQQRPMDAASEFGTRNPGGLKALAVWNNNLTKDSGLYIADLLAETVSLELLNIGKNCLSNEFVCSVKESLAKNTTLTTLGLQSAHLSAKGIETLSSVLTFGGNSTLQRIDIRDNKLEVESLTKIADVLKSNTTVTQIDIDDEPKRLSVGTEAHLDYARVLENVRSMCSRNEKTQAQIQQEKSTANVMGKTRGGYYLGSRKISLTCQSRPVVDSTKNVIVAASNSKLDIKRKAGTRLRSPVPSPTTVSPSSSPNRASRFQVFRVAEASPLTSPNTQKTNSSNLLAAKAVSMSSAAIPLSSTSERGDNGPSYPNITSTSLPTSCSLPSMSTVSSSTQSIKRLSVSPRSRFLVRKVYEDPNLPLPSRYTQPITPPINPPPTPISRNAKDSAAGYLGNTTTLHRGDDLRQDTFSCSSKTEAVAPKFTIPATFTTPPTIITPQQETNNTTTDTSTAAITTPILKISEDTSLTSTYAPVSSAVTNLPTNKTLQCEKSTNQTVVNDNNIKNQTQTAMPIATITTLSTPVNVPISSNNLQSSPSILSTLSTLSSSSDSSSSTSTTSSSSSSSSTSPASNSESSDSSLSPASSVHSNETLSQQQQHDLTSSGQCPIAVFSDNDITLTKNTANEVFGPVAAAATAAASKDNLDNIVDMSNINVGQPAVQQQQQENQPQQQRVRKVSWISNPTAVDKLLTLFHNPTTIFQRSLSPETKPVGTSTTTMTGTPLSQSPPTYAVVAAQQQQQQQKSQTSLVPMRKQSPPSWTKLGNDIMTAAATNSVDLANTVATTVAAAVVTEQSKSFFDFSLRDFGKQVFRQNLSFGNEPVNTASTSTTTMTTSSALNVQPSASENAGGMLLGRAEECCGCVATATGCLCGSTQNNECNADCIPTEVKQEIKENISPEHTINEETLHTMQKLWGNSAAMFSANLSIKDDNNLYVKTSTDYTGKSSSQPAAGANVLAVTPTPSPPPTTTQMQHSTVATASGIESELPAHNT